MNPVKVIATNHPDGRPRLVGDGNQSGQRTPARHTQDAFLSEIYIERDDFMENPPKKFFPSGSRWRGASEGRLYNKV